MNNRRLRSLFDASIVPNEMKLNVDVQTALDLLSKKALSKSEQKRLDVLQKVFDIDPSLTFEDKKKILRTSNEMFQTRQSKRTDQTFYGLKKRHIDRVISGADDAIRIVESNKKLSKSIKDVKVSELKKLRNRLKNQKDLYNTDNIEGVVFERSGDKIHVNVLEFSSDQTSNSSKLRTMMSEPIVPEFDYKNMVMNVTGVKKSYVENMVLDAVQNGFESIGIDKALLDTQTGLILKDIAQRFNTKLVDIEVPDMSSEIPITYEFSAFVFPKELVNNVENLTGYRFIRSIDTATPILVDGNVILQLMDEDKFNKQFAIQTIYGDLKLKVSEKKIDFVNDVEGFEQTLLDLHNTYSFIDIDRYFDNEIFTEDVVQDRQIKQARLAKETANEYKERLADYITLDIEGLDEIEAFEFGTFERTTERNDGVIEIKAEDERYGEVGKKVNITVQYKPGERLSVGELIAMNNIDVDSTKKVYERNFK